MADTESMGMGIRVLVDGGWGFAATDDLTPAGIEKAIAKARAIAKASTLAMGRRCDWRAEPAHQATWASACRWIR